MVSVNKIRVYTYFHGLAIIYICVYVHIKIRMHLTISFICILHTQLIFDGTYLKTNFKCFHNIIFWLLNMPVINYTVGIISQEYYIYIYLHTSITTLFIYIRIHIFIQNMSNVIFAWGGYLFTYMSHTMHIHSTCPFGKWTWFLRRLLIFQP